MKGTQHVEVSNRNAKFRLANLELGQLRIFEKDICLVNMEPPPDVEIEEVE